MRRARSAQVTVPTRTTLPMIEVALALDWGSILLRASLYFSRSSSTFTSKTYGLPSVPLSTTVVLPNASPVISIRVGLTT